MKVKCVVRKPDKKYCRGNYISKERNGLMISLSHLGKLFMSIKLGIGLLGSVEVTTLYTTSELSYSILNTFPPSLP